MKKKNSRAKICSVAHPFSIVYLDHSIKIPQSPMIFHARLLVSLKTLLNAELINGYTCLVEL